MGRIEMAQGGTLFLDELGEMPLSVQPKLLRVLQEYELERVGSTKKIHLDIRIVAATNRDLREMIKEGKFREDLFYRISVINVKLPPLRDRKEDIIPISLNYLERLKTKMTTPLRTISHEAEQAFLNYSWPGNIRELQNVVEYARNLCDSDTLTRPICRSICAVWRNARTLKSRRKLLFPIPRKNRSSIFSPPTATRWRAKRKSRRIWASACGPFTGN